MESSESKTEDPSWKPALWGGTPQYDYVCFEKCTRYGIPLEAGHEAGPTGDDLRSPENSLSYPQVGLDSGMVCGSTGLPGVTQALGLSELTSLSIPSATSSPLHLLTPGRALTFIAVLAPRIPPVIQVRGHCHLPWMQ